MDINQIVTNIAIAFMLILMTASIAIKERHSYLKRKKRNEYKQEKSWVQHLLYEHCRGVMHVDDKHHMMVIHDSGFRELHIERTGISLTYRVREILPDAADETEVIGVQTSNLIPAFEQANRVRKVIVYFEGQVIGIVR